MGDEPKENNARENRSSREIANPVFLPFGMLPLPRTSNLERRGSLGSAVLGRDRQMSLARLIHLLSGVKKRLDFRSKNFMEIN